jgi:hypothetical protein
LFVEYEDLVKDPKKELKRIHVFLGLPDFDYDFGNIDGSTVSEDDENIHGENFPGWQFHRWDQSILTNLIVKNNLKFSNSFINNITHNFFLP